MMHVVHVVETLDPSTGGPAHVVVRLAAAQARLGARVTVLSRDPSPADGAPPAPARHLPGADACLFVGAPAAAGRLEALAGREGRRTARALIGGGCDFVHLHGVWESLLRVAAAEARRAGTRYALTPHGMLDPWSLSQSAMKKRVALALGYRAMLDGAAFLQALNLDEAAGFAPLALAAPVVVAPNGVFLEELEPRPDPEAFRRAWPTLGERPFVLFLARLHWKKGLDHLADAFSAIARARPDWMLVVAGPDGGARAEFEQRIARAALGDRVLITGPLFGEAKRAALAAADLFCLPSRQEGFSVALAEALAFGLPVVASAECHFPEIADAGAGAVVPLSTPAVADALLRLTAADADRVRMGRAARDLVRARYVWPEIAARLLSAYAAATAAHATAPGPASLG